MAQTRNFADIPAEYCDPATASIVIVPVPYDGTSTWLKGADKGPKALMDASVNLELYDIETDFEVYRWGIFVDEPVEGRTLPEEMVEAVRCRVLSHAGRGRFTVVVGGEHSVSIGSVAAYAQTQHDMTVLQLDAHSDLRDEYLGSRYNHACVMARIRELCPMVQVGIRSMDICEKKHIQQDRIFFAEDICRRNNWIEQVVAQLSQKVYITIDLDVFDPSIMLSTGTPEPGGLSWYEVLALLRAVCIEKDVVAFDVVELCPNEINKAPDYLAAKLVYKLLSYKFVSSLADDS
jgi:agmatinase